MVITTSICANYLPKAKALGQSIKKYMKDDIFLVCLTEQEIPKAGYEAIEKGYIDGIVLSKDLGLSDRFNAFMFKHKIVEASTSVKGMLMKHLYEKYPDETQFAYFDPDCMVFSDCIELKELLVTRPIVLCPHLMHPGHIDMEISSIKYGVYNLGFLAVNRDEEALKFIDWWAQRLFLYCYDDLQRGLFTDQRWVDLAPTFFDVELLQHYGYDFGTWAVKGVEIDKKNGQYYINNDPLRLAHFSGYDGGTIEMVQTWWTDENNERYYNEMINFYTDKLNECGQKELGKLPWTYACYDSGEKISDYIRVVYREDNKLINVIDDPYKYSNKAMAKMLGTDYKYGTDIPKWAVYTKRGIDIWVTNGFFVMIKKFLKKCLNKFSKQK